MYRRTFKIILVLLSFIAFTNCVEAQKPKAKKKAVQKAPTPAPAAPIVAVQDTVKPAVVSAPPPVPVVVSLPLIPIKKSLRPDNGSGNDADNELKERVGFNRIEINAK